MKKILNSNIFRLLLALLFLVGCAGVGSAIAYVEYESNPIDEATTYFRALVAQDYETMYKQINTEDKSYVNKAAFMERMKSIRESYVIDSYEFSDPYEEDGKKMIDVKCNDDTNETSQVFKIVFDEVRKSGSIIPDYKVNIDSMLVDDLTIVIPRGDTLYIDSEAITVENADIKTEGENDIYSIRHIMYGNYTFKSENQYNEVSTTVEILRPETSIELAAADYTANAKYETLMVKNSEEMISQFYADVRNRKSLSKKLKAYFTDDKKLQKKVKKYVKESQEYVYWLDTKNIDDYQVISMEMSKLKHRSVYSGDNKFTVTYEYSYTYVSSTDTELFSSYTYNISGSCKTKLELTYTVDGDNVTLTGITMKNKHKKNQEAS